MPVLRIICILLFGASARAGDEPNTYDAWSGRFHRLAASSRNEAATIERELDAHDLHRCRREYFQWLAAGGGLYERREAAHDRWRSLVNSAGAVEDEVRRLNGELYEHELVIAAFERGLRYRRYRLGQAEKHVVERAGLIRKLEDAQRQAAYYEEFAALCDRLHKRLLSMVEADRLLFQKAEASPIDDYLKELTPRMVKRRARQILEEIP